MKLKLGATIRSARAAGKLAAVGLALLLPCASSAQLRAVPIDTQAAAPRLVVQSGPRNPLGLAIVLSPDKLLLATAGGKSSAAYVWQAETGRLLCTLKAELDRDMAFLLQGLPSMTFSADGYQLATAKEGEITVWDVRRCSRLRSLSVATKDSEIRSLLTLPDGQVLASSDSGALYKGDLFSAAGGMKPLPNTPHRSSLLYGLSGDGRQVLTRGPDGNSDSPFAPSSLRVIDVRTGVADSLASYRATSAAPKDGAGQMSPVSAALSPSGRWVIAWQGGFATLYDRTMKAVVGQAQLALPETRSQAGKADAAPNAQQPKGMPPEVAAMLKALPPSEVRSELEQQMKSMLAVVEQAKQSAMDGAAGPPGWVGFSDKEDHAYLWTDPRLTARPGAPLQSDRSVVQVRRLPDLALVKTAPILDTAPVNRDAAGAVTSFAASRDGTALAVSFITGDISGGRTGLVDLTQLPTQAVVRGWKPTGGAPGRIDWTADGQLVAVHGGALGGGGTASLAGRVMSASQPLSDAPNLQAVLVQWSLNSGEVATRPIGTGDVLPFALSPGGRFAAVIKAERRGDSLEPVGYRLEVVDAQTQQTMHDTRLQGIATSGLPGLVGIALSADGRRVAVLLEALSSAPPKGKSDNERLQQRLGLHDTATGRLIAQRDLPWAADQHQPLQPKMRFLAEGKSLAVVGDLGREFLNIDLTEGGTLALKTVKTGSQLHDVVGDGPLRLLLRAGPAATTPSGMQTIGVPDGDWGTVTSNAAGTRLAASDADGGVQLFDVAPGGRATPTVRLDGHAANVVSLAFSPDGRLLASSDEQGSTFVRDAASGALLARLFAFTDGSWAVVDSQGRFDTNRLEDLEYVHWVMPDDPLRALPLDIFMREYFTPGLLGRLMRGETLPEVRPVNALNRAQPMVRIAAITPSRNDPRRVDVTVEAEGRSDAAGRAGGVFDLRLFRDGRLVGSPERLGEALTLDPQTRRASRTFRDIRLPQAAESVVFSAYAFNTDRVKGATARSDYRLQSGQRSAQKGKAYLITIGVNRHDNPAFDLRFAAQDARLVADALSSRLAASQRYGEVVPVQLVSDGERTRDAGKARIRAVLAVLAGRPADRNELAGVGNAARLAAATPDDLVIITFSGHGHADDRGVYYLLPQDIGAGSARRATPQLLAQSISSDELEAWLRDVDAGELALVIDACHAAASVEGEGFKPGPMGSRGLGQLAYDKGMRILAASQADDVAREPAGLRQGLLTFVLMRDGLEAGRADFKPSDRRILLAEWLSFGVQGVPQLQRDLARGDRALDGGARPADRPGVPLVRVQQPRLFNFGRQGDGPLIEALR